MNPAVQPPMSRIEVLRNAAFLAGLSALVLLAGCADRPRLAVTAFQCPRPGTQLSTSAGGEFVFTSGEGFLCRYQMLSGYAGTRYAMLVERDSAWMQQGAEKLRALWPLKVGNSVWFESRGVSSDGSPGSWYETYTVTGTRRVTVPAGTFDTFVIDWEEQGREGNSYSARNRFYFAPVLGYFVKFEPEIRPGNNMAPWVATRVEIPAG